MITNKNPLFLRFINKEVTVTDLLHIFMKSTDQLTAEEAERRLSNPPDLSGFHAEMTEAVSDLAKEGIGDELKAFVNNYMAPSLEEDISTSKTPLGENQSQMARIKDPKAPWVQGFLCYNLCLYLKGFGTSDLKKCRICGRLFANKGPYAVYCSDTCKSQKGAPKAP